MLPLGPPIWRTYWRVCARGRLGTMLRNGSVEDGLVSQRHAGDMDRDRKGEISLLKLTRKCLGYI